MRISYISSLPIRGGKAHCIQMMKMCEAMLALGHDVQLIAPQQKHGTAGADDKIPDERCGMACRFPIVELGHSRVLGRTRFQCAAILRSRRHAADAVYTRDLSTAAMTSLFSIPTYLEMHQVPGGRFGPWYFRAAMRGPGLRKLVAITQGLLDLLMRIYPRWIRDKEVVVAPDGVDLQRYESVPSVPDAARELGAQAGRFRVGYTGSLYKGRGLDLILELARSLPDVEFWIVGGQTPDVDAWREKSRSAGVQNMVFWGHVPNAVLPRYQAACHVLLMPFSRMVAVSGNRGDTSMVMSPMKMFEYLAAGRLIVSSDLPVLREVLGEHNAVLCPPDDVAAWIDAVRRARQDGPWREAMGAQARLDAQKYSWENRVRLIFGPREAAPV